MKYYIERFSFAEKKISYRNIEDLNEQLSYVNGEIQSLHPCTPDATDVNYWIRVYYKFNI